MLVACEGESDADVGVVSSSPLQLTLNTTSAIATHMRAATDRGGQATRRSLVEAPIDTSLIRDGDGPHHASAAPLWATKIAAARGPKITLTCLCVQPADGTGNFAERLRTHVRS